MSGSKKTFAGEEFSGTESLNPTDINDWIVDGMGGEVVKNALDDFDWDGGVVAGITLKTSIDNKKVANSNIFLTGEFMKGGKEIRASRLFPEADKELRISYFIEEASVFTFRSGTMVGEVIDDHKITWNVLRKGSRGNTDLPEAEYEANKIGNFSIRPFIVPLSSSKARITLLVFPITKADLESLRPHSKKPSFPGLELMQTDVDFFPRVSSDSGKAWGCPIIPFFHLGSSLDEHPNIPTTDDIKAAISKTLRACVVPSVKRDLRTLASAWTSIQESGALQA